MLRKQLTLLIVIVSALLMAIPIAMNAQTFVQPGLPFTREDLDELKNNLTREPWKTGFQALAADWRSNINYSADTPCEIVGRAPDVNRNAWINDMVAIHNQAFMWIFTDDPTYAENGIRILNKWATMHRTFSGDESHIDLGDQAHFYLTGADILRTYKGWTDEIDRNVKKYFEEVYWPHAAMSHTLRPCNQGALQVKFGIGLAVFLQDPVKFQQALEASRFDGGGGFANSLPNGQLGDAGRDEGHWFGQYEALVWAAEVLWKQGLDIFSEGGNRLLAVSELYTRRMVDDTKDTWIPFGGCYDWGYFLNFGAAAGARRHSLAYAVIENAYENRLGTQAPYTTAFKELIGSGNNFLYIKDNDLSQAKSLAPITFPQPVEVRNLTSLDIGKVGLTGSARYTDENTWVIKGTGSISQGAKSDAFRYAFQPVELLSTGEGLQVIAHLSSLSNNARAGVMIRNSLDEDADYVGFMIDPNGQSKLVGRGIEGWNATRIGHHIPALPHWFKLERFKDRIGAYHSHDGVHWTCAGMVVLRNIPDEYFAGVCLTSTNNNPSWQEEALFSQVAISRTQPEGAPVITGSLSATAYVNEIFNYEIAASGNPASFSATGLPEGMSIDAQTGKITGKAEQTGRYIVSLSASNTKGMAKVLLILNVVQGEKPGIPTGVVLKNIGINEVTLQWDPVDKATGYAVKRALIPGGNYETVMTDIPQPFYTDKNAYPGYNYYVVTAQVNGFESEISHEEEILLPPDIPQNVSILSTAEGVTIQWGTAKDAEKYNVKRSGKSGGPYQTIAKAIEGVSFADNTIEDEKFYYYVVTSLANEKESQPSKEEIGAKGIVIFTWSPTAASPVWSEGANWIGGVAPATPAILSFGASAVTGLENDIEGLEIARILFEEDAPAYTLSGNAIKIKDIIRNNSEEASKIQFPMELTGEISVEVNKGPLHLEGTLSGTGSISKRGKKSLTIIGENTYSGGTTIYESTLDNPLFITGKSLFEEDKIIYGALGTGDVDMAGGTLQNTWDNPAWLYNDINFLEGTENYTCSVTGGLVFKGSIKGKGSWSHDGGWMYDGLTFEGDNREFEGTFSSILRTSHSRIRFPFHYTTSAKAHWHLESNFSDNHSFSDTSQPYQLGALTGKGLLNMWNNVEVEIGHLNEDTEFSGVSTNSTAKITKVGAGKHTFSGILSHRGNTTVKAGKLLISGVLENSSVIVENGAIFGGSGWGKGNITVNQGGVLATGDDKTGTYTTYGKLTLKDGAVFDVELGAEASDKIVAGSIVIENAQLSLSGKGGEKILIIDNTGSQPIEGQFNGLDELDEIPAGNKTYCITYKGGDGNDVVLIDADIVTKDKPSKVRNPQVETLGSSQVKLIWEASPESEFVKGYIIKRALSSERIFQVIEANLTATEFIDKSLIPETAYTYQIQATNFHGDGEPVEVSVTTGSIMHPAKPEGIIAYAGSTNVLLRWEAAFEATSYKILRSETSGTGHIEIADVTETVYNDTHVEVGKTYYYILESVNAVGSSGKSAELEVVTVAGTRAYWPMDEGSGNRMTDVWNNNAVDLKACTWTQGIRQGAVRFDGSADAYMHLPVNIMDGIDDFTIASWVKLDASGNWARVWDFGNGTNQYMFLSVNRGSANTPVRFEVKNGSTQLRFDSESIIALNAWTHLTVTKSGKTVVMYLNGKEENRHENITVRIQDLGVLTQNYIGKSQWPDAMFAGIIDDFRIYGRALSAEEIEELAKVASVSGAPSNVKAKFTGYGIKVDWDEIPGATYNVKRSAVEGGPYTTIATGKKAPTHTDFDAKDGIYYYVVIAIINNLESEPSEETFIATYGKPASLQHVTISPLNSSKLRISWDASSATEHVTGYTVEWSSQPAGVFEPLITGLQETQFVHESLTPATMYYYKIYATNYFGNSETVSVNTRTPQLTLPHKPSGLKADPWNNQAILVWDVATEAYTYTVKRSSFPDGPFETIVDGLTDTSYTDATVVNESIYYYTVISQNPLGSSGQSSVVSVTPSTKWTYWTFNEGKGTKVMDAWNQQPADIKESSWTTDGKFKGAIEVGATSSAYVHLNNEVINRLTDFTIALWVKQTAYGGWARMWDFGRGTNNYMFLTSNTGSATSTVRFAIKNGGSEQIINCSHIMTNGEWTHIAVTKSGSTGIIYVNGAEVGKSTGITLNPSDLGNLTQSYLAKSQFTADAMFKGGFDDFRIYNAALTPAEILSMMAKEDPVKPSVPQGVTALGWNERIDLSWDKVYGTTSYRIKRSSQPEGFFETVYEGGGNRYSDEGLTNGETYYYVVTAVNEVGEGKASKIVYSVPVNKPGFDGMTHDCVGSNDLTGNAGFEEGKLTVYSNSTDEDAFYFVFRKMTGNVSIVAKVESMEQVDGKAKTGIMMRAGAENNSPGVWAELMQTGELSIQTRAMSGPYWVKMVRNGTIFKAFLSDNGIDWILQGEVEKSGMPDEIYVGLATFASGSAEPTKVVYSSLSVSNKVPELIAEQQASGKVNATFSYKIQSDQTPYLFEAEGLPSGLSIDIFTGEISGVPTVSGTTEVALKVTNATGEAAGKLIVSITRSDGGDPGTSTDPDPAIAAPANLTVTLTGRHVELRWDKVKDATSYSVKRSKVSGGPYTVIASGITTNSYTDESIETDVTYYYVVTAWIGSGQSGHSNEAAVSSGATSIDEIWGKSSFRIYPNPVRDHLNIEMKTGSTTVKRMKLIDMNGIIRWMIDLKTEDSYVLDMSRFPSGMYLLTIEQDGLMKSEKVIKVNN